MSEKFFWLFYGITVQISKEQSFNEMLLKLSQFMPRFNKNQFWLINFTQKKVADQFYLETISIFPIA